MKKGPKTMDHFLYGGLQQYLLQDKSVNGAIIPIVKEQTNRTQTPFVFVIVKKWK